MIQRVKAWVRQRAEAIVVAAAIALVLLMMLTGPIIDFLICICLLGLLKLSLWLGKR
ncbi:MAG: hypothetical protein PGN22_15715 [Agrobacterium cavarae]